MKATNPRLLNIFSDELPLGFLEKVKDGFQQIYKEAHHRGHDDPAWDTPEANYLVPHLRRAMAEKLVRDAANSHGLSAIVKMNSKRTSEYTIVSSARLLFTVSHCTDRSQVRYAKFRQQNSELNSLLSQGRFEVFDTPEILQGCADSIYAILIYGDGFIEFAIPDADGKKWLDHYPLDKLIEMKLSDTGDKHDEADKAFPMLKMVRKLEGDEGA